MKPFTPPVAGRVTRALILVCLGVQLALTLAGPYHAAEVFEAAALVPARVTSAGLFDGPGLPPALTLLTAVFLHGGWGHIALNLLFLGLIGRFVEWALGSRAMLWLFLLGGIAGSLAQVASDPDGVYPVVGASGAISAVFGAYAMLFAHRQATTRRLGGGSAPSSDIAVAARLFLSWLAVQLLLGFVAGMSGFGVAIWAHVGGFLFGLLFVMPRLLRARRRSSC